MLLVVTNEAPEWRGSASELLQLLPEIDMQPNVFTRKLNVSLERLLIDYNIKYESVREHSGRKIKLSLILNKGVTIRDGGDGILHTEVV